MRAICRLLASARFPVAVAGFLGTAWSLLPGQLIILALLAAICAVATAGYFLRSLCLAVAAAAGRRWADCALRAIGSGLAVPLAAPALSSGDYVHFALMSSYYFVSIAMQHGSVVRFPWGDQALMIPDGFQERFLVYDPDSATRLLVGKARPSDKPGFRSCYLPLLENFYLEHVSDPMLACRDDSED